jgi:hypothetical protein
VQTGEVELWPLVPSSYLDRMLALKKLKTQIQTSPFYTHLDFN